MNLETVTKHDLIGVLWREYEWIDPESGAVRVYKIDGPVALFTRPGGTTHRIVDALGTVHCVPAVGWFGCVARWQKVGGELPVRF